MFVVLNQRKGKERKYTGQGWNARHNIKTRPSKLEISRRKIVKYCT
jgi:hypothetical protein